MTLELNPPEVSLLIIAISTRIVASKDRQETVALLDLQGRLHALLRPQGN